MDPPRVVSNTGAPSRPRRVSTIPLRSSTSMSSLLSKSDYNEPFNSTSHSAASKSEDIVETLYNHPSVRIISFTSGRHDFNALIHAPPGSEAPPGSLPPSSRLERTIAAGAFRIYRAPGSVAFLSCGSALQPIFPKSQCWCINEDNSRFVLQIRRPQYWRIEIPVTDPDDAQRAVLLRDVLDKVLLFEKTECPFERSFTVRLPDPPTEPVRKKAWTAEGKNLLSSPFHSDAALATHPPIMIGRGRRSTSVYSRDIPLLSGELVAYNAPKSPSILEETGEKSSGDVTSNPEERRDLNASHSSVSVPLASSSGGVDDHPVSVSEQATATSPTSSESITQDSATSPEPTRPSFGAGVVQDAEAQKSESPAPSLSEEKAEEKAEEKPTLHEEIHTHSTEVSRPSSPAQSSIVVHQPRDLDCTTEAETASHDAPQIKNETGTGAHLTDNPETTHLGDVTPHSPDTIIPDTEQGPSSLDQMDDIVLEPDHPPDGDEPVSFEDVGRASPVDLTQKWMTRLLAGPPVITPPQLTLVASPPSRSDDQFTAENASQIQLSPGLAEGQSPSASTDSFHSVQSCQPPTTPQLSSRPSSCLDEHTKFETPQSTLAESAVLSPELALPSGEPIMPGNAKYDVPDLAAALDSSRSTEFTTRYAPTAVSKRSDKTGGRGHRRKASRLSTFEEKRPSRRRSHANLSISRRSGSPLPPAANLFSPPRRPISQGPLAVVRQLPAAFVQKTVEILLSPPGHLVNLMLKVAAKIAAGEWRGLVFGFGEAGEQIPVQWDYYSDGDYSDLSDDDDYIITDHSPSRKYSISRTDGRRVNDDNLEGRELD
ncbi:inheritance of peroxisomes protein 1-domain-containing protein [Xylaria sp. CBS 124048]|nr:inheritance of peroxisomes protein 1-domain-containing protein [Xylaria sp. CBS 124048]